MNDKLIEIEITDLAYDGKAVGHKNGKVVFLKGGLPGETVLAEVIKSKPRYDTAIVKEITQKSHFRVPTVCSHFTYCGGCTWQDLDYSAQLIFKKKQVVDCMERIGGLPNIKIFDVIGSQEIFGYRNKMEFSFNVDATKEGFTLGLHHRGSFYDIFNLKKCYLTPDITSEIVRWMQSFVKEENIPVYDVKNHTGYMRFLMIRQAKNTPDLMVNIVTNYGELPVKEKLINNMTKAFPSITTIVHNQNGQKSNIAIGEKETILWGQGFIEERLFDSIFRIRTNSFFQTNSLQAETLYQTGFEMLNPQENDRVLDLYCGTGTIGILLAPRVKEVIGVELVADAIKAAQENASLNKTSNISFYEGHVKDFLKNKNTAQDYFNVVIIDPPRAGLHPKALKQLLILKPEKILYISCNPATFARDAKRIIDEGYQLPEIKPVDMFPHTMHIELAAVFHRL